LQGLGGLLAASVAGLPLPAGLLVTLMTAGAACWRLRFRPSAETQA
jgi:hypothetical protein